MTTKQSLFEKLGGNNGIKLVLDDFYARMVVDPKTRFFFKGINIPAQKEKMKSFLSEVTGGPKEYKGKDLKTVHKEMPINEAVFEATLKNLNDSLEKFKVGPEIIDDVMSIMKSTKNDVVSVKVYPKL